MGGFNAPYTYPDVNNMFLAAVDPNGNVLSPSYYRQSIFDPTKLGFNNQTNANWTNPVGKYLSLRPRPIDQTAGNPATSAFPYPGNTMGDVANLPSSANTNDSIWIDIGFPILTAPGGKLYKPLFAPLSSTWTAGSI